MGPIFARSVACAVGGLLAWLVTEPFQPKFLPLSGTVALTGRNVEPMYILLLGGLVGLVAGVLHGLQSGSRHQAIVSGSLGAILGAIGSTLGQALGSVLAMMVTQVPAGGIAYMDMPGRMFARFAVLLMVGLGMGGAIGAAQRSVRGLVSGLVGGAIGGGVCGFGFDLVLEAIGPFQSSLMGASPPPPGFVNESGGPGRALFAVGSGLFVGLFTAWINQATRRAWLRLEVGRNEGREWPIDAAQTLIGRDERAHVPLFSDPNIPGLAAVIARTGNRYVLQDPGSHIGIGHNGMRVPHADLRDGDSIQIGSLNLVFRVKAGHAAQQEGRAAPVPIMPVPSAPVLTAPNLQSTVTTMPHLVAVTGPLAGHRYPLTGQIEIGRDSAQVPLGADQQASRRHAMIQGGLGSASITDLGSTNGTFVNGARVQQAELKPGDAIRIGSTTFRIE